MDRPQHRALPRRRGTLLSGDLLRCVVVGAPAHGKSALAARLREQPVKRRLIVVDTPGDERGTREVAAAASNADLAVLVVDAQRGLEPQSRRHAFLCSLLGVPRVVVAVNKMDLVGHSQARFEEIRGEFEDFAARLAFRNLGFMPVGARDGDNLARAAARMPWYHGLPLAEHLESVYIGGDRNLVDLRFAVQSAARAGGERWHRGQVASGVLKVGDPVVIVPSHRRSRVRAIALGERRLDYAFAPMSVSVALEDDIEAGRGALLAHPNNVPRGVRELDAMVVWMGEQPLAAGQVVLLKHGASWVRASCSEVAYRMDADSLHRGAGRALGLNDIGRAHFTLFDERFVDPYARNRGTGAFIMVDPQSNLTLGAGVIVDRETDAERVTRAEAAKKHIVPTQTKVAAAQRARLLGQRPFTLWLTGLSGAGKSTLALELERRLIEAGRACYLLDGDNIRAGINRDLGFGPEDRRENIRRIAEVARLMNEAGLVTVTAFISPYREDREMARQIIGPERFVEVYVSTPLEECERRDPKGLYRKARKGEIPDFTGVSAPYEPPAAPEIVVQTAERSIEDCVAGLFTAVAERVTLR